jgi:hypothetical protein
VGGTSNHKVISDTVQQGHEQESFVHFPIENNAGTKAFSPAFKDEKECCEQNIHETRRLDEEEEKRMHLVEQ